MAAGAASDGFFRYIYDGCIAGGDAEIDRRPYHKNCQCALHKGSNRSSAKACPHASPRCANVSYPIRRAWSEGSLVLQAAAASCHSSPSSSPSLHVAAPGRAPHHGEAEECSSVFFKV